MKHLLVILIPFLLGSSLFAQPITERNEAYGQSFVGFGPGTLVNLNSKGSVISMAYARTWNADDKFDIALGGDVTISTGNGTANMWIGHIGANYIFPAPDFAPFVGASLGYGVAHATYSTGAPVDADYTAGGFAMILRGGVKFFPKSTVNLGVLVDYTLLFDKLYYGSPNNLSLKVGVYF